MLPRLLADLGSDDFQHDISILGRVQRVGSLTMRLGVWNLRRFAPPLVMSSFFRQRFANALLSRRPSMLFTLSPTLKLSLSPRGWHNISGLFVKRRGLPTTVFETPRNLRQKSRLQVMSSCARAVWRQHSRNASVLIGDTDIGKQFLELEGDHVHLQDPEKFKRGYRELQFEVNRRRQNKARIAVAGQNRKAALSARRVGE